MLKNTNTVIYPVNAAISPSTLLRSRSNPLPQLCKCGDTAHGQVHIDVLPSRLFVRNSSTLFNVISQLARELCRPIGVNSEERFCVTHNPLTGIDDTILSTPKPWWRELFNSAKETGASHLSPFVQIWRLLIYFSKLFSPNRINNGLVESLQMCRKDKCVSSCPCNGLQIRLGMSAQHSGSLDHYWCPSSREIASEVLLAWAKLNILERTSEPNKNVQNLTLQSFPVIQNWADFLTTGKIGIEGSTSLRQKPEEPVINVQKPDDSAVLMEETDLASTQDYHTPVILLVELGSDELSAVYDLDEDDEKNWIKLSKAWQAMVEKMRQQPNTIVLHLDSLDMQFIAKEIHRIRQSFCHYQFVGFDMV